MKLPLTRVCIIYPADPAGSVPGGIDTFIRGQINNAPDDIKFSVVGITTNESARPVGKWSDCELKNGTFRFFPVLPWTFTSEASFIPVTVRYMAKLGAVSKSIEADVLEFHRIEPLLRFRKDPRPKTAVLHQNMMSLYDKQADIRWSSLPKLYFWLENKLVPNLQSIFCVRADAAEDYRSRFPDLAESCRFQPTWADPQQFHPPSAEQRRDSRLKLVQELSLPEDDRLLISVGRLDAQKDPLLMVDAISRVVGRIDDGISLLMVGEGPLREEISKSAEEAGVLDKIHFLGLKNIDEVTELLHAADLFVMSSAYEGMPMAVIEALASGVPVATTRVGEVDRVVEDRVCGLIAESRSADDLADAIEWCLRNLDDISGQPCVAAASQFSPAKVLEPVYENYRRLAAQSGFGG
jgi:glycosyltransferase involved in cell wall biosynthesis